MLEKMIKEADRLNTVTEYYFSRKLAEVRKVSASGTPVINLGIGNPDLPPSDETVEALVDSAKTAGNHGYQSYRSIPELRESISSWMKSTYSVVADPETEILPLIGSKEGITHITWAFVNPGDVVLVPNPGYPTYSSVSNIAGAEIIHYDLKEDKGWQIDIEQIKSFDLSKVKVIWINYPNMPTGTPFNADILSQLIQLAKENDFLICHDNPYSLILNDKPQSIFELEDAWDVCLELNSLSKSHNMAGWRLGWLTGSKEHVDSVLKVKSNVDSGMFLPVQHAAVQALKNPVSWHDSQNDIYRERKEYASKILDLLNCTYDALQVGMFIWAKIPEQIGDVEEFIDKLLYDARVFITPGKIFGSNGERYIRISLCMDKSVIEEACKRIETMIIKEGEVV